LRVRQQRKPGALIKEPGLKVTYGVQGWMTDDDIHKYA